MGMVVSGGECGGGAWGRECALLLWLKYRFWQKVLIFCKKFLRCHKILVK